MALPIPNSLEFKLTTGDISKSYYSETPKEEVPRTFLSKIFFCRQINAEDQRNYTKIERYLSKKISEDQIKGILNIKDFPLSITALHQILIKADILAMQNLLTKKETPPLSLAGKDILKNKSVSENRILPRVLGSEYSENFKLSYLADKIKRSTEANNVQISKITHQINNHLLNSKLSHVNAKVIKDLLIYHLIEEGVQAKTLP